MFGREILYLYVLLFLNLLLLINGASEFIHTHHSNDIDTPNKVEKLPKEKPLVKKEEIEDLAVLVDENILRVQIHGKCSIPVPVCQRLPSKNNIYIPACALVHRCSPEFGCCPDLRHECLALKSKKITLHFMTSKTSDISGATELRSFDFTNHTECSCQPPSKMFPILTTSIDRNSRSICHCPKQFWPIVKNNSCWCKCDDQVPKCRKLKSGRYLFSKTDVTHIEQDQYGIPFCKFGDFRKELRRCPKKKETRFTRINRN